MNFGSSLADVPLNPADYHPGLGNAFTGPRADPNADLSTLERTMFRLGLRNPLPRALLIGSVTSITVSLLQPSFAFDEFGPREFGLGDGEVDGEGRNPSLFTWWSTGALAGFLTLVFT